MRLLELFDTPETEWILRDTGYGYGAEFSIGDNNYYVDLTPFEMIDIVAEFQDIGETPPKEILALEDKDPIVMDASFYLVKGGQHDWRITGTGNEYKVFATVIAIIKNFLAQEGGDVQYLHISAKEQSRTKLYARMIRSFNMPTFSYILNGEKAYMVKVKK